MDNVNMNNVNMNNVNTENVSMNTANTEDVSMDVLEGDWDFPLAQKRDTQARKYQLTINNPLDVEIEEPKNSGNMVKCPFDHEEIKSRLKKMKSIVYYCMGDEIGLEEKTPHTHVYFAAHAPIRFSTVKNLFPTAHIESAYGDSPYNRDYILKKGKWAKTDKSKTTIEGTFEEYGTMPLNEKMGARGEMHFMYDMIKNGLSTVEMLDVFPESFRYVEKIDRVRQIFVEDKCKNTWRDVKVEYIYGKTETGKTRSIMEKFGYSSTFRCTDYAHPFDRYDCTRHKVMVFEEFHSSLRIQDMLNYLDGYPCELVARYTNKVATYLRVFIVTNIPLEQQYPSVQKDSPETWEAFLRRINKVRHYLDDGTIVTYDSVEDYLKRDEKFHEITETEQMRLPFKD